MSEPVSKTLLELRTTADQRSDNNHEQNQAQKYDQVHENDADKGHFTDSNKGIQRSGQILHDHDVEEQKDDRQTVSRVEQYQVSRKSAPDNVQEKGEFVGANAKDEAQKQQCPQV